VNNKTGMTLSGSPISSGCPLFMYLKGISQQDGINQLNDKGEKIGLWIENNGLIETYYL